ncbi:hypothetical protein ACO0QE_001861 [Hanseniaspora vineae]
MGKKSSKKANNEPVAVADGKKKGGKNKKQQESTADEKQKNNNPNLNNRSKVTQTSSWTGKLPHTLLHEQCQKRKWNKVEYDMRRIGDKGMLAMAILSYTDPKTRETLTVKMNDPVYRSNGEGVVEPQETPLEARHFASTLALHRIAYNVNLQMMLPPNHRILWNKLESYRKTLLKDNPAQCAKIFDTDPFKTILEERKLKEQEEKQKQAKLEQERRKKLNEPVVLMETLNLPDSPSTKGMKVSKAPHTKNHDQRSKKNKIISFPKKVWESTVFIDLSEQARLTIEQKVKKHINWIAKQTSATADEITANQEQLKSLLLNLGFSKNHVEESLNYSDPLSFLLFNLPAEDLPAYFKKRQEDSKNVINFNTLPLADKNKIERLMEVGCSMDEVQYALEMNEWKENQACSYLTSSILPSGITSVDYQEDELDPDMWENEVGSLQAIYGEATFKLLEPDVCLITFNSQLKMKVYKTAAYPFEIPGLIVSTFSKSVVLPNYIKREILTKLVRNIQESNLLGDMMLFYICDWLQENVSKIVENPGPLLDPKYLTSTGSASNGGAVGQQKSTKRRGNSALKLSNEEITKLKNQYNSNLTTFEYKQMISQRQKLPAWKKQDLIVDIIMNHQVTLITGETGSGKSTQVVQFLLDELIAKRNDFNTKIICTQPRRISAIGLGERVSDERCTKLGEDEVGYIIRGVNKTKPNTRIKFMTTGVLVRVLQGDLSMLNDTIVVIDEVHERSIDTDLIVILLKNVLKKVKNMKIVLMSATVSVEIFQKYFKNLGQCHIEGRTFPITEYFLDDIIPMIDFKINRGFNNKYDQDDVYDEEDDDMQNGVSRRNKDQYVSPSLDSHFFKSGQINYDLISETVLYVDKKLYAEKNDGSIIVFLPGVAEIDKCCRNLRSLGGADFVVLPLHSALSPDEQKKVFNKYKNKRKIVVATNIAETSITIDDCVVTIDTGRAKSMFYSAKDNTTRLVENFISKAESKQRKGRAGRVRSGYSYKLYSKDIYENTMIDLPIPEIRRVALESLYLNVKAMNIKDVIGFLSTGLDPPPLTAMKKAESLLTTGGLLSEVDQSLTQLGKYISMMPVMDAKHGKILIYSILFGCADIGVLIASVLSVSDMPFIGGFENRDRIKKIVMKHGKEDGDLLAVIKLVFEYLNIPLSSGRRSFLHDNLLSYNKMNEISSSNSQFYSILKDTGFLPFNYKRGDKWFNRNGDNMKIVRSILTGAFYPNLARVQLPDAKFAMTSAGAIEKDPDAKKIRYWIRNEEYIEKVDSLLQGNNESQEEFSNGKKNGKNGGDFSVLPATKAFIHPSSVFFDTSGNNRSVEELAGYDNGNVAKKDGSLDKTWSSSFILFNSSSETTNKDFSKLYLRGITPTNTISVLLFGASFTFETSDSLDGHSSGIVVDKWLPVRTWCKNGVLIKELRLLLDEAIQLSLENPAYKNETNDELASIRDKTCDILEIVEQVIQTED